MSKWSELAEQIPESFDDEVPNEPGPKSPEGTTDAIECEIASVDVMRVLTTVPKPFIEPEEKSYASDVADRLLPRPSFITDFVNIGRGTETPTFFLIWGALWTISTALNRGAWVQWYPHKLWPNLYILFVAPAGLCKKSMAIDIGQSVLEASDQYRADSIEAFLNHYRFVTSKASPQGIYMMLKPEPKVFMKDREIVRVTRPSKIVLSISELATLFSRQQYMTGLVNDITDLYDCKDKGEIITQKRGVEPLEKIYVTMAGAITPTGLEESVPEEMMKGGLVSRMVIAYQDLPTKIYPRPIQIPGYPTIEDVGKKLAWIAYNAKGEYSFTDEAEDAFSEWYTDWKSHIIAGDYPLREDEHRRDITLRKVAMLMRASEYRPGNDITLENFIDAQQILDYTLSLSARLMVGLGGNDFIKNLNRVKAYIDKKKHITRREIMNRYGGQIPSTLLTMLLNQLLEQGYITGELNGKPILHASTTGKEMYTVAGGKDGNRVEL